jgi:hypothetical protein
VCGEKGQEGGVCVWGGGLPERPPPSSLPYSSSPRFSLSLSHSPPTTLKAVSPATVSARTSDPVGGHPSPSPFPFPSAHAT